MINEDSLDLFYNLVKIFEEHGAVAVSVLGSGFLGAGIIYYIKNQNKQLSDFRKQEKIHKKNLHTELDEYKNENVILVKTISDLRVAVEKLLSDNNVLKDTNKNLDIKIVVIKESLDDSNDKLQKLYEILIKCPQSTMER